MSRLPPEIVAEGDALFHDMRCQDVDPEEHARFVIERVVERGTMRSVAALVRHYGEARVRAFFVEGGIDRVSPPTAGLWRSYFSLSEEECTPRSSRPRRRPFWPE